MSVKGGKAVRLAELILDLVRTDVPAGVSVTVTGSTGGFVLEAGFTGSSLLAHTAESELKYEGSLVGGRSRLTGRGMTPIR